MRSVTESVSHGPRLLGFQSYNLDLSEFLLKMFTPSAFVVFLVNKFQCVDPSPPRPRP